MNIAFKDYPKIIKDKKLNGFGNKENIKKEREYLIVSKLNGVNVEEYIDKLRRELKDKYYIVETMSGNFDYSNIKNMKILGIGGGRNSHTSYLTNFITGSNEEILEGINEFIKKNK